jgi:hypothetical protein
LLLLLQISNVKKAKNHKSSYQFFAADAVVVSIFSPRRLFRVKVFSPRHDKTRLNVDLETV